jgi:hypothetical protein
MRTTCGVVLAGLLAAAAHGQGTKTIENPAFANWAKFPKGTAATLRSVTEAGGNKTEATVVYTLVELTADKAVVEAVTTTKVGGMEIKTPAVKMEHPKSLNVPDVPAPKDVPATPKASVTDETVTVAGTAYKTKRTTIKTTAGPTTVESESWTSADAPGLVVKSVTKATGQFNTTTTLELVEVKKP